MQSLNDKTTASRTLEATSFLIRRLGSRPQTRELVAAMVEVRQALRSADDSWQEARTARMAATAEVEFQDEWLDGGVMQVGRVARALVEGQTGDPRYTALFPIAPSAAMAPVGGDAQARFVKAMIQQLEGDDAFVSLRHHATTLTERAEALTTALAAREELYLAEAQADAVRTRAADAARRAYNLMYPRLQLIFPDRPTLVESFFLRRDG